MYLGKNIRFLRKSAKMSQTDLAEKIDVVTTSVSGYESEKATPSFDVLLKMAEIFEVSLDDLVHKDMEREGAGPAKVRPPAPQEEALKLKESIQDKLELIRLLKLRVAELEREIRRRLPAAAQELGIEGKEEKEDQKE